MRKAYVIVLLVIFLMACSDQKEKGSKQSTEKIAVVEEKVAVAEEQVKAVKNKTQSEFKVVEPTIKLSTEQQVKGKYIALNNEKFELLSDQFIKGAKVFNVLMAEQGLIRGTFIVIIKEDKSIEQLSGVKNTVKIAKDTYKITPSSNDDLLEFYHSLLDSNLLKRVEIEIDYSGKRKPTTENY